MPSTAQFLLVWHLGKVAPRLELPVHVLILWLYLGLSGFYWPHLTIIMASLDPKMS